MLSWFLNPWMLLGGLAIASPILIHLLNKRRFKIVEWAAMDFLFQADKKNRRRVQLENFILLALRCLAMLFIALMLARPFLPSSVTSVLNSAEKFERVILIDDSLSQRVLNGAFPAMQTARESARNLVTDLANSEKTEEYLTVMLTSDPDQPLLANEPLNESTVASLIQTIDDIESTEGVADYRQSLESLRQYVSGTAAGLNRVVYVFSDLRQRDWSGAAAMEPQSAANRKLTEISELAAGCFLVDVGSSQDGNLSIGSIRPEGFLVSDKVIRFNVDVVNHGTQTVSDIRVLLQIDEGQPVYETIASIAPGQQQSVSFRHVFNSRADESLDLPASLTTAQPQARLPFVNYRVRAELDRSSLDEKALAADQLLDDSSSIFAARVLDGISVLLVDGDPSAARERSETHYLRSLQVPGTGLKLTSVTVSEFENISLTPYAVVFLCNVDEASAGRLSSLEQWTRDGGSVVLMPGNRVRAATFNGSFYRNGDGLSPLQLNSMAGDPTMMQWVNFEVDPQIHPALQVIVDSDASSLGNVDVFSWWTSELDPPSAENQFAVPLRLTDQDHSVAMADRSFGSGKVIVFTIPGDGDWTMWPGSPTFAPVMIDMIDYLVGQAGDQAMLMPGDKIEFPVDVTIYDERIALRDPSNEKVEAVARPAGNAAAGKQNVVYEVEFDPVRKQGFYTLEMKRHDGLVDQVLFATRLDPRESPLQRMTEASMEGDFFGDRVKRVSTQQLSEQSVVGANTEIWMQLLLLLFGVLVTEQFLGWWWGRRR